MKWLAGLCFCLPILVQAEGAPIEYRVVQPDGYSLGTQDGRTVYEDMRRGSFDREPMYEVLPQPRTENLPPPAVIPFSTEVLERREVDSGRRGAGAVRRNLPAEDRIFKEIEKSQHKNRCYMTDENCVEIEYLE